MNIDKNEKVLELQHSSLYINNFHVIFSTPFLFDVLKTVVLGSSKSDNPSIEQLSAMATAYAVLMKARYNKLSAWHRMTTAVAIRGHLEDTVIP
jgi:hypothetical protein